MINQHLFYLRVNASLTILSLICAHYHYFVTEKTGRGIEITTRGVTYSPGTVYFPELSLRSTAYISYGTCHQANKNVRCLRYLYGILIGKCVECIIITAVTHCGPQTRNFCELGILQPRRTCSLVRLLSVRKSTRCWLAFVIQGLVSRKSR